MENKLFNLKEQWPIGKVCQRLGLPITHIAGTETIRCPMPDHTDTTPSFMIHHDFNRFKCHSCSVHGDQLDLIMQLKNISFKDAVRLLDPKFYSGKSLSLAKQYLYDRNITKETISHFNIKVSDLKIGIPLPNGGIKYRVFGKDNKYEHEPGTHACLFKTAPAKEIVVLCEGEMDAIKLWQETRLPTWTGSSGAKTFLKEWIEEFRNIEKIYLCYDNDAEGREGSEVVAKMLGESRCYLIKLPPEINDITEYFQSPQPNFTHLMENARRFDETTTYQLQKANNIGQERLRTGFTIFDIASQGLRYGGAFLIGGNEKSGKSSYALNLIDKWLKKDLSISYFDTELDIYEVTNRLTSICFDIKKSEVEKQKEIRDQWRARYGHNFFYKGIADMSSPGTLNLSFERSLEIAKNHASKGIRIFFFDNLTTYGAQIESRRESYQVISDCITKLINFSRQYRVLTFFIIHSKKGGFTKFTPDGIYNLAKTGEIERIFEESKGIIAQPALENILGGMASLSQISGAILIWRPLQNWSVFYNLGEVILTSYRDGIGHSEIRIDFDGEKHTFTELEKLPEENVINSNAPQEKHLFKGKYDLDIPYGKNID